jgi:hypothetical protein
MILVGWFFTLSTPFAADITVSVDRSPIKVDESFQILFTASEAVDGEPDFSPLEQDFNLLNQSQNSRSSWVNGKANQVFQWAVTVMANDSGTLIIPKIKFGRDTSAALSIKVLPSSANKALREDDDLFLDVSVDTEKPYLQAQVIYTLKLYRRIDLAKGNLSEPELPDAVIEKLADDSNYTTQLSGVTYAVTERKYAIFPQKSGMVTIKPLILNADVIARNRQSSSFFNAQITQRRVVKSKAITLNVQPAPTSFNATPSTPWLAAEKIEFTQAWSGDTAQMKMGEPMTRTIRLVVYGSTVGQLPELNVNKPITDLKAYSDQPILHEEKTDMGLIASREEKIAYIPTKSGHYSLPAMQIIWFNTKTEQTEIIKLPEITLIASESDTTLSPKISTVPEQTSSNTTTDTTSLSPGDIDHSADWWRYIAIFSSVGWLLTIILFIWKKFNLTQQRIEQKEESPTDISLKNAVKELKTACMNNDATAAKIALLQWGLIQFNATNLGVIAAHSEARLRDEIIELNTVLYSQHQLSWQGKKLFQAFSESNARVKLAATTKSHLQPLYRI